MSSESGASSHGPRSPADSSYLDDWLRQRRQARDAPQAGEVPEGDLDIESLLPEDTRVDRIDQGIRRLVKGQDSQVREISVLLSMHLQWAKSPDPLHQPPNAIALGPTGTGKTFTLQTASSLLKLPFISVDTTSLVPSGIVGLQIEDVLRDLVTLANDILEESRLPRTRDDDLALAERGIIVFDEFDKVALSDRDVSANVHVQRRLLKLCEGSNVPVGLRTHTGGAESRTIDTRGILIVGAGAFEGIEKYKAKRPQSLARRTKDRDRVFSIDIQHFGFIPELVARLPVLIQYGELSREDLRGILDDPDTSPLSVWSHYVTSQGSSLVVSEQARDRIAERALETGLGARGLQQVIFPILARLVAEQVGSGSDGPTEVEVGVDDVE